MLQLSLVYISSFADIKFEGYYVSPVGSCNADNIIG